MTIKMYKSTLRRLTKQKRTSHSNVSDFPASQKFSETFQYFD